MKQTIKKLPNHRGVKLSSTLAGQRELIREMRNTINSLIDALHREHDEEVAKIKDWLERDGIKLPPVGTYKPIQEFCSCSTPDPIKWDKLDKVECVKCGKLIKPIDTKELREKIEEAIGDFQYEGYEFTLINKQKAKKGIKDLTNKIIALLK